MRKHNGNTVRLCVFLVLTLLITAFGPDTCFSEADITGRNAGGGVNRAHGGIFRCAV